MRDDEDDEMMMMYDKRVTGSVQMNSRVTVDYQIDCRSMVAIGRAGLLLLVVWSGYDVDDDVEVGGDTTTTTSVSMSTGGRVGVTYGRRAGGVRVTRAVVRRRAGGQVSVSTMSGCCCSGGVRRAGGFGWGCYLLLLAGAFGRRPSCGLGSM